MRYAQDRRRGLTTVLAVVLLLTTACVTPVGVKVVDWRTAHREMTANALSADEPSVFTKRVLLRDGLLGTFEDDDVAVPSARG